VVITTALCGLQMWFSGRMLTPYTVQSNAGSNAAWGLICFTYPFYLSFLLIQLKLACVFSAAYSVVNSILMSVQI